MSDLTFQRAVKGVLNLLLCLATVEGSLMSTDMSHIPEIIWFDLIHVSTKYFSRCVNGLDKVGNLTHISSFLFD